MRYAERKTHSNNSPIKGYFFIPGIYKCTAQSIIADIQKYIGFPFLHKTRKREIVEVRQVAMYVMKLNTKLSLAKIGMHCGGKDHATVLHACKTIQNLIDTKDKEFLKKYSAIFEHFNININPKH